MFDSFDKLLAMLLLQVANLETYQNDVDASAADIAEVNRDAAIMKYIKDYHLIISNAKKVITGVKQAIYKGRANEISQLPLLPAAAPPFELVSGCLERANERNRRFKAAKGYSEAVGSALGIEKESRVIQSKDVTPEFEITPSSSGFEANLIVRYRGKSDMWRLFGRRDSSEKFVEIAAGTGRAAKVKINPTDENQPERLQVQVRLYRKNQPYGQQTNFKYITFNP